MIVLDVVVNAMVAGANAGAGEEDVVWVRDIAERDLSRNSTMAYRIRINAVGPRNICPTFVSVIALYRLSTSSVRVLCKGTTRVGTVARL